MPSAATARLKINSAFALAAAKPGPSAAASLKIAAGAVSQKLRLGRKEACATVGQSLACRNSGSVPRNGHRDEAVTAAGLCVPAGD
jgi:hypothetical protein